MLVVLVDMVVVVVIAPPLHVKVVAMPAPANDDMVGVAVVVIAGMAAILTVHMSAAASVTEVVPHMLSDFSDPSCAVDTGQRSGH